MEQKENQGRPRDGTFILAQKCEDMILYGYKALQQKFNGFTITKDMAPQLVDKVREYFGANNISYGTFSFDDLIPFLN